MDEIIVQVQFKADTKYGEFRDALNMPLAEYENLSKDEIESLKQSRISNWVAFMDEVKLPKPEPTKSQLQARVLDINFQIDSLNNKKSEILLKIAEIE